jgi:hypothetical protein
MRPVYGLRLIMPPREINVVTESGRLRALNFKKRSLTVTRQSGPWKLSGNWWYGSSTTVLPFNRLYYEIDTEDNRAFLLYFDRALSSWFLQGVFD